jgi:hypothetical protein
MAGVVQCCAGLARRTLLGKWWAGVSRHRDSADLPLGYRQERPKASPVLEANRHEPPGSKPGHLTGGVSHYLTGSRTPPARVTHGVASPHHGMSSHQGVPQRSTGRRRRRAEPACRQGEAWPIDSGPDGRLMTAKRPSGREQSEARAVRRACSQTRVQSDTQVVRNFVTRARRHVTGRQTRRYSRRSSDAQVLAQRYERSQHGQQDAGTEDDRQHGQEVIPGDERREPERRRQPLVDDEVFEPGKAGGGQ